MEARYNSFNLNTFVARFRCGKLSWHLSFLQAFAKVKAIEDENESLKQQAEIEVESRKESDGER